LKPSSLGILSGYVLYPASRPIDEEPGELTAGTIKERPALSIGGLSLSLSLASA
jgi:hypothetical protein